MNFSKESTRLSGDDDKLVTQGDEEYLLVRSGSEDAVSSGCQPGVRVVPLIAWSLLGSPPFCSVHHCPVPALPLTHSPRREVVSGAGSHGGCPPHGFWATRRSGVVLAVGLALAIRSRLFGLPAREV